MRFKKTTPQKIIIFVATALVFLTRNTSVHANKLGVNTGSTNADITKAIGLVGNGTNNAGWVVILAGPNNCQNIIPSLNDYNTRLVIRAWNGGCAFTQDHYLSWVATLANIANSTPNKQIYFVPWNEPNHPEESVGGGPTSVIKATTFLAEKLAEVGLRSRGRNKVVLLSPAIDPLYPAQPLQGDSYFSQFDGIAVNAYAGGSITDANSFISHVKNTLRLSGNYSYYLTEVGTTFNTYTPEDAAVIGKKPVYEDGKIATFFQSLLNHSQVKMAAILDHDPHCSGYGALCGTYEESGVTKNYYGWDLYSNSSAPLTRAVYQSNIFKTANIPVFIYSTALNFNPQKEGIINCPASTCASATKTDMCGPGDCSLNQENKNCRIVGTTTSLGCSKIVAEQKPENKDINNTEKEDEEKKDHPLTEVDDGKGGTIFAFLKAPTNSTGSLQTDLEKCILAHGYKPCTGGSYCNSEACKNGQWNLDGLGCPNHAVYMTGGGDTCDNGFGLSWKICDPTCNNTVPQPSSIKGCCPDGLTAAACDNMVGLSQEQINEKLSGWMTRIIDNYSGGSTGWVALFSNWKEALVNAAGELLSGNISIKDVFAQLYVDWDSADIKDGEAATGNSGFQLDTVSVSSGTLTPAGLFGQCLDCSLEELVNGEVTSANFTLPEGDERKRHLSPGTALRLATPSRADSLRENMSSTVLAGQVTMSPTSNRGTETVARIEAGSMGLPAIALGAQETQKIFKVPTNSRTAYQPAEKNNSKIAASFNLLDIDPKNPFSIKLTAASDGNVYFPAECVNGSSNPCAFFSAEGSSPEIYFQIQTNIRNLHGFEFSAYNIGDFSFAHTFINVASTIKDPQNDGTVIYKYGCGLKNDEASSDFYQEQFSAACPAAFNNIAQNLCATNGVVSLAIDVFDTGNGGPIASFYGNPENNPNASGYHACWGRAYFGGGAYNSSSCQKGVHGLVQLQMCSPNTFAAYNQSYNNEDNLDVMAGLETPHQESGHLGTIIDQVEAEIDVEILASNVSQSVKRISDGCSYQCDGVGDACNPDGANPQCGELPCKPGSGLPSPIYEWTADFTWKCQWKNFTRDNTASLNPKLSEFFDTIIPIIAGWYENGQLVKSDNLVDKVIMTPNRRARYETGDQDFAWAWAGTKNNFNNSSEQQAEDNPAINDPIVGESVKEAHFDPLGPLFIKSQLLSMSLATPNDAGRLREKWVERNPGVTQLAYIKPEYSNLAKNGGDQAWLPEPAKISGLLGAVVEALKRW